MSRNPILIALDALDDEPSAEFTEAMRARLFAELVSPRESGDDLMGEEQPTLADIDVDVESSAKGAQRRVTAFEPRSKRTGGFIAAAAGIALIAGLAVAVTTRGTEPAGDTSGDREIADAALISLSDLGSPPWHDSHLHDHFSTRDEAVVAARVPGCSPYVDYVFDSPDRQAATSQKDFRSDVGWFVSNVVSVFPSKAAASQAMDKIAEPAFRACLAGYLEAAAPLLSSGDSVTSVVHDAPPLLQHGDRQIAFETVNLYEMTGLPLPITSVNIFIQVDRAIVYINPVIDTHNSLDPSSAPEVVMRAATDALTTALSQPATS